MFLGQILKAIQYRKEFKMTSGRQLREYHHIDDEVLAIYKLVDSEVSGIIELSHGSPVMLKDLAKYIFTAYESSQLLKIGVLDEPEFDNYKLLFERPSVLNGFYFRDTLPSVIEYLRTCTVKGEL